MPEADYFLAYLEMKQRMRTLSYAELSSEDRAEAAKSLTICGILAEGVHRLHYRFCHYESDVPSDDFVLVPMCVDTQATDMTDMIAEAFARQSIEP